MDKVLELPLSSFRSPSNFGEHPDLKSNVKSVRKQARKYAKRGETDKFSQLIMGKVISLSELKDPRHPEVIVIPRNRFYSAEDEWGDVIGFERKNFPFSSTDFHVDTDDKKGLFYDFIHSDGLYRLSGNDQLGYLVPPRPEELDKDISILFQLPTFPHNLWSHSLSTAVVTDIVLARNGFSFKERAPVVLAAGSHDIATPAGGDSVKRVDPKKLDEEENFSWSLKHYGLAKKWRRNYGFNLG